MKALDYDDDDYYDDDGYESPDPEEQEFLQQCTAQVLQQLRAGQPSVTVSKEEAQEALWHYYNDVEKSVNYLRGTSVGDHRIKYASRSAALRGLWVYRGLVADAGDSSRVYRQKGERDAEAADIAKTQGPR